MATRKPPRPTPAALRSLDREEVRQAIETVLMSRRAPEALDVLVELGLMDVWLPEVAALVGFGEGAVRHKDVWKHSKQVVWQSVPTVTLRWAALLHDIGKVRTRGVDDRGQVHFHRHAEVGAAMFQKHIAPRIGLQGDVAGRIHFLIYHHLRPGQYDESWTDSAVRRFLREMGDGFDELLKLSRADITTARKERRRAALRQISHLSRRSKSLAAADAKGKPLPKGLGTVMSETLGIPPSKRLGELRALLELQVQQGVLEAHRQADYYVAWLRQSGHA